MIEWLAVLDPDWSEGVGYFATAVILTVIADSC